MKRLAVGRIAIAIGVLAAACTPDAETVRSKAPIALERLQSLVAGAGIECAAGSELLLSVTEHHGRADCTRADGIRHGPFMTWRHDETRAVRAEHVEGEHFGPTVYWLADGETRGETFIFHAKNYERVPDPNGLCPQGSLLLDAGVMVYHGYDYPPACRAYHPEKGDVIHGRSFELCELDHPDGPRVRSFSTYVWGVREGPTRSYWSENQPRREASYQEGRLHGPQRHWFRDATLAREEYWDRGLRAGTHRAYLPDGSLRWEARFDAGKLVDVRGNLQGADGPCPEGSLPVGHEPPDGEQITCVDVSGEPRTGARLAAEAEELRDSLRLWKRRQSEGCGPRQLEPWPGAAIGSSPPRSP